MDDVVAGSRNDVIVAFSANDDIVASAGVDIVMAGATVDGLAATCAEKVIVRTGPNDRRRFDHAEVGRLLYRYRTVADCIGEVHFAEHAVGANEHPATVFGWCQRPGGG